MPCPLPACLSRFPSDLLLTSSSGELWRMVRIGGQPLGFGKGCSLWPGDLGGTWGGNQDDPHAPPLPPHHNPQMSVESWLRSQAPWLRPTSLPTTSAPSTLTMPW